MDGVYKALPILFFSSLQWIPAGLKELPLLPQLYILKWLQGNIFVESRY